MLTFFPYISIPVRYILPDNLMNKKAVAYSRINDSSMCQNGTSKGVRTIITTGEVKGIIDSQKVVALSGLLAA